MKYSLIIPHFGESEWLERLLLTLPIEREDLEVIVVDDCSPNQSALVFLKNSWPQVRWLSTLRNGGAGAARNVALAHARGDYLVFADSDDEFLPGAFDTFDEHVRPEDELVYFLAEAVQEVDRSPSNRADRMNNLCQAYIANPTDKRLERLKLGHVNPVAKVYSRYFIETMGVNFEEISVSNDVAFNVLAAVQARSVRVVPKPVYRIYRREGSLTNNDNLETLLIRIRVLGRLNRQLDALDVSCRTHAGAYIYRALCQGPFVFFRVFREALSNRLVWTILPRLTVHEVSSFICRFARSRKEKERM